MGACKKLEKMYAEAMDVSKMSGDGSLREELRASERLSRRRLSLFVAGQLAAKSATMIDHLAFANGCRDLGRRERLR